MQVPILRGVFAANGEWRTSYPVNMVPVPVGTGISDGFLRLADGIVQQGDAGGIGRGAIVWNGDLYRVMGDNLVRIDASGIATTINIVGNGGTDRAQMTYSFDRMAVAVDGALWLYDGSGTTKVIDADLGTVNGVVWIDGYFVTTDGEFLVVTELNNPLSVDPLKYGSSEADPDPIVAILKVRNELIALNRHTIEVFDNVGGTGFPFQRVEGAQVMRGVVGPAACCVFSDMVAFVGSGRNEAPSVYFASNGASNRIATREVDRVLSEYTDAEIASAQVESREYLGHAHLIIHLPRHTLVFDAAASQVLHVPVWFVLSTDGGRWAARDLVYAYGRWNVAHTADGRYGYLDEAVATHWGDLFEWRFDTPVVYNEGRGAVIHELELVSLASQSGDVCTQYSVDAVQWSQPRWVKAGAFGQTNKRLSWRQQGILRNWRIQRFSGWSDARVVPTRLEARVEALAY